MGDLNLQLKGYRLTTAEILYRLPDYKGILQSFVWQDLDLAPQFPVLKKFLDFWQRNLDGPLFKVRIAHVGIIHPSEVRHIGTELMLH